MNIGNFVKKERLKKDISIVDLSLATKIPLRNIEYLESNQFDKLPHMYFVMGYVKNISSTLKIEHQNLISLLNYENYQYRLKPFKYIKTNVSRREPLFYKTQSSTSKKKFSSILGKIFLFFILTIILISILNKN